ncbi:hypothetical protein NJ7G_3300 [Natrinema sp. J7-2]|nr:hypothetical protein NJ7G_3300 [Natrinema sp. J7-2]
MIWTGFSLRSIERISPSVRVSGTVLSMVPSNGEAVIESTVKYYFRF